MVQDALVGGALGSVLSTVALMAAGKRETGSLYAPTNASSQWIWGDDALQQDGPSLRYTLTGYLIHHASAAMWAAIHSRLWGQRPDARSPMRAATGAVAAAAAACFVDYRLTPRRLTPGFEHRLSRQSMALVYAMFAAGLALGSIAMSGQGTAAELPNRNG
jgi:hypothetical protein